MVEWWKFEDFSGGGKEVGRPFCRVSGSMERLFGIFEARSETLAYQGCDCESPSPLASAIAIGIVVEPTLGGCP